MSIILASSSTTRHQLLKKIIPNFQIVSPNVDEESVTLPPHRLPGELSKLKAYAVFKDFPQSIVIAADTVVIVQGKAISKPQNHDEAIAMLKTMRGTTYPLLTGVTILSPHFEWNKTIKTTLKMKMISDQTIHDYVHTFHPLDKAGGYAGDDNNEAFYETVDGLLSNTYGLPIEIIKPILDKLLIKHQ